MFGARSADDLSHVDVILHTLSNLDQLSSFRVPIEE